MRRIGTLLITLSALSLVFCFNIENDFTVVELNITKSNLQFGYTIQFLNNRTLIVGAPPAPPHNRTDPGNMYSCDIHKKNCEPFQNIPVKPLTPASNDRCFKSPYDEPCGSSGTKVDRWYYDPVSGECKVYQPQCSKDMKNSSLRNVFDNQTICNETCYTEIQNKAKDAKYGSTRGNCVLYVQNVDLTTMNFMKKLRGGIEESVGEVPVGSIIQVQYACEEMFVAKYLSVNAEYVYLMDEDNKYDVVFKPDFKTFKNEMMLTIGSMPAIYKFLFKKTFAPMGLSLTTTTERSVACKPHWSRKYVGTVGKCFFFNETRGLANSILPLQNVKFRDMYKFSYGLSGFSMAHTAINPELLFVGAPYGGGRNIGTVVALHVTNSMIEIYGHKNNPIYDNPDDYRDAWGNMWGFSLAAGNVHDKSTEQASNKASNNADIVGGGPRGGDKVDGVALVVRYSSTLTDRFSLLEKINNPDTQTGSYFGAAVCMADVNNDQKDDILVGAPYHAVNDPCCYYDVGRVYVFTSKQGDGYKGIEKKFVLEVKGKDGKPISGGLFGSTIANIGDVNKDGFVDVAVGAPGGGKGAVYIYNGNAEGIDTKYSQVIDESRFGDIGPGFGISIAGGVDVNDDTYKDIAVGSYLSPGGKAHVFKTRPVIYLKINQTVSETTISPEPSESNCQDQTPEHKNYYCITLNITMTYTGEGIVDTFDLNVTLNMDSQNSLGHRAFLHNIHDITDKIPVTLKKDEITTLERTVEIKVGNNQEEMDLFTPITLEASYSADEPTNGCGPVRPCPILAKTKKTSSDLVYKVKCTTSECKPYLKLKSNLHFPVAQPTDDIIYGVTNKLVVKATMENTGETAYQTKLDFKHHPDFDIQEVLVDGLTVVLDDKKKPIPVAYIVGTNLTKAISIKLTPIKRKPSTRTYIFELEATAIGIDNLEQKHNKVSFNVSTSIETCLKSTAKTEPKGPFLFSNSTEAKRKLNLTNLPANRDLKYYAYGVNYKFYVTNDGGNTIDNLLANVSIVDEVKGVNFMCIEAMFVGQVPCEDAPNCVDYLQERQRKANTSTTSMGASKRNVREIQCSINSIKMRRRAEITLKTWYFPDMLSQLSEFKGLSFPNDMAQVGDLKSNFTAALKISHGGEMASLYYQRSQCSSTTNVTARFIDIGDKKYEKKTIPAWIYAAAVAGALLLLLLLILILIKLGFFKKEGEIENEDDDEEDDEEY